jgi:hypothetical protein
MDRMWPGDRSRDQRSHATTATTRRTATPTAASLFARPPSADLTASGGIASGGTASFSTGAMKRYPRFGRVSTNRGDAAESSSTSRILVIALFRPVSKSTNVSDCQSDCQSFSRNSSRVTSSPDRSRSETSTRRGCSWIGTFLPAFRSSRVWRSTSKTPKRIVGEFSAISTYSFRLPRRECGM